ncbi:MarR family winged helix-turn-helix transcriptional regulator [Candidatus Enterovibrio escicola]|uniref:MarR family transcriptional regulator n=1 Tax=Candidatus Enterovibrio escicola TaxID=1927127 RepID=A0A2A5T129_9GAMM|nr:MarR family winged helix-turn-helix transcriptional regulator [Candidatus Enterovibrio escacola]PCS21830.1 hypothetical protein BTN49_2653 [Candidatus Enterovibrio escacola]
MNVNGKVSKSIVRFRRQVEIFRKEVHHDMHILQMLTFLEVVNNDKHTVNGKYIEKLLSIGQTSASRHCRRLLQKEKGGFFGLCVFTYGPKDALSKYLELTDEGKRLAVALRPLFLEKTIY